MKSLKSTFAVLILKSKDVEDLKDFRSIRLIGSLDKLLANALVNWLKKVMKQLVKKAQKAFVEGKQLLDASLIVNEIIDSIKKKECGFLCKLDIEKA